MEVGQVEAVGKTEVGRVEALGEVEVGWVEALGEREVGACDIGIGVEVDPVCSVCILHSSLLPT